MKKWILLVICFFSVLSAFSIDKKELLSEEVVILKDKFTTTNFTLYTNKISGESYQIKSYAEAPINIISRDNFIGYYCAVITMIELVILSETANLDNINFTNLDEIIGSPDMIINIIMTKNGIQFEVNNNERNISRNTILWEDL